MANPPITIGPFTNVPAPGSPIKSDWAQQITTYVTTPPGATRSAILGKTDGQTLIVGETLVTFNANYLDTGGFTGTANKFTIPVAGLYLVSYSMPFATAASNGRVVGYVVIANNGARRIAICGGSVLSGDDGSVGSADQTRLGVGETLDLRLYSAVARQIGQVGSNAGQFTVSYQGP